MQAIRTLTVATDDSRGWMDFLLSAERYGWDVEPLGWGQEWRGLAMKLKLVYEALTAMPRDRMVLFTDSYDAVFLRSPDEYLVRCLKTRDIFMSAETNCHPHAALEAWYPESATKWRFLNSGGWLAYAGAMRDVLEEMKVWALPDSICDQGLLTDYFLSHPWAISLDYDCDVFQTLWGCEDSLRIADCGLRNIVTGTRPYVLHANGGTDMSFLRVNSLQNGADRIPIGV